MSDTPKFLQIVEQLYQCITVYGIQYDYQTFNRWMGFIAFCLNSVQKN